MQIQFEVPAKLHRRFVALAKRKKMTDRELLDHLLTIHKEYSELLQIVELIGNGDFDSIQRLVDSGRLPSLKRLQHAMDVSEQEPNEPLSAMLNRFDPVRHAASDEDVPGHDASVLQAKAHEDEY